GQSSICVKDGIIGVFPPLLYQSSSAMAGILHKPISVNVSVFIDPFQSKFNVRPQCIQQITISGALVICSGEHNEQRRSVYSSVIPAEGDFSERGHFTVPHFVQN